MSIDHQEQLNECRINTYNNYLCNMKKKELLAYFNDMEITSLVVFIKEVYGNDGRDDCNFESYYLNN
jgi:hypothetical protein